MNFRTRSSQAIQRRKFLQNVAAVSAGAFLVPATTSHALAKSPNQRKQYALIGAGGNGTRTTPVAQQYAELVALCDVDQQHLSAGNQKLTGGKANTYNDYREVLSRDDIDFVQISTPDHWHAKILIEAMLAGKDAYCEKPLTLTIDEGKQVRKIQRQTGRVVQVGTQQRSSFNLFNKALAIIAEGRLGKLKKVTVGIDAGSWSPEIPIADVPKGFDWESWLGPGPKMPYRYMNRNSNGKSKSYTNGHAHFRWWYEHSGGKLTDWGAHHVDIAMLGIAAAGQNNDPVSVGGTAKHEVEFIDGQPVQHDRFNTARAFNLNVEFTNKDVTMNIRHDVDNGILFEGDRGRIFVNRRRLVGKPVEQLANRPLATDSIAKIYRNMPMEGNDRPAHWANFMYAIENRASPIADVHSHMKMLNICHLAGICCRLGRQIRWDQQQETVIGDRLAASMLKRPYREGYEIEM